LFSDAIVFSFSFLRDRFFTASARAGPEAELSSYQDFGRKSSSFDFRVGLGMIILRLTLTTALTGAKVLPHIVSDRVLQPVS